MDKTYDIGEGVLRLPLCDLRQVEPCLAHEYRYMTLGMYYEIREDDLYLDYILYHHHRAPRIDGADHFYQISI